MTENFNELSTIQATVKKEVRSSEWIKEKQDEKAYWINECLKYAEDFNLRWGPDKLNELIDNDGGIAYQIFGEKKQNSLIYELETERHEYFPKLHRAGIDRPIKLSGNSRVEREKRNNYIPISEERAAEYAKEFASKLVRGCKIFAEYENNLVSIEGYKNLSKRLEDEIGDFAYNMWAKKYFNIIFPNILCSFYSNKYIQTVLNKLEIECHDNYYVKNGSSLCLHIIMESRVDLHLRIFTMMQRKRWVKLERRKNNQ